MAQLPTNLVLLPPAPFPASYPSIKAAYHAPLLLALRHIKETHESSALDIILPCPHLYVPAKTLRSTLYEATQEAVANLYKLICIIAVQQKIEVANIDGDFVDVRVILLAYPRDGNLKIGPSASTWYPFGPVIDLTTLAKCNRSWTIVFSVETEQGEKLLQNFSSRTGEKSYPIKKLRGGIVSISSDTISSQNFQNSCQSVAVGGTFDHLHIGHKLLLTMTSFALDLQISSSENIQYIITIGMTAAQLLEKKKYAEVLESWSTRTHKTSEFLKAIMSFSPTEIESVKEIHNQGPNGHAILVNTKANECSIQQRFVEIWDPFGPTITDPDIDTIVVSGETSSGGKMVNDKRKELGMKSLRVFEVNVLDSLEEQTALPNENTFQSKLSSTEIRKQQADRIKDKSKV